MSVNSAIGIEVHEPMPDGRKFSRKRRAIKLGRREEVEKELSEKLRDLIKAQDPTIPSGAAQVMAELGAVIVSQLMAQTQTTQRSLKKLRDDVVDLGTDFASQLVTEARKDTRTRLKSTTVAPVPGVEHSIVAEDWAGPVAGPSFIEERYGIPRSTLYRWQKRGEAIALQRRTSRKPAFPLRQFVDGKPADGIPEIVAIFNGDQKAAWMWLVSERDTAEAGLPLYDLLEGNVSEVLERARASLSK